MYYYIIVLSGKCPESATRGSFLSTFATATEQVRIFMKQHMRKYCMVCFVAFVFL